MPNCENVLFWRRYLSPCLMMARKAREKGLDYCVYKLFIITWQKLPSGLRSFARHAGTCFSTIVGPPISLLLYGLGVRLLVNCKSGGMGHLAIEPAWFLIRKRLYGCSGRCAKYYVLVIEPEIANNYLIELFRRDFIIFRSKVMNCVLDKLSRYLFPNEDIGISPPRGTPYNEKNTAEANARQTIMLRDFQSYRNKIRGPFFELDEDVLAQGRINLGNLGIRENDWFVCLHAGEVSTNGKYSYDLNRRQKISDYYCMIEHIAKNGGKAVRMGDKDLEDFEDGIPLINYPKSEVLSDWMDLYLISRCKYFIGCSSGLSPVAALCNKPLIMTNYYLWHSVCGFDGDIYLPKMIRSKDTGNFLSVEEYVNKKFFLKQWDFEIPEQYEYIPNAGEDLINAVKEMEEYLKEGMPEQSALQKAWAKSLPYGGIYQKSEVRISHSFIIRHEKALFRGCLD